MDELAKSLKARHLSMIALGGSIGTGIFLASGYSIWLGGPAGALLAYSLMAIIVYLLMTSLGEMSTHRPSSGSFCDYSTLYVGKSFGFAMSYNYWLNWAITVAAEIAAATLILGYWLPNPLPITLTCFGIIVFVNLLSVKIYGEVEYWLSLVKVLTIVIFIILGIYSIAKSGVGLHNWHIAGAPWHNGWHGFLSVFIFAGFSFQGTELVGVASGETVNPAVNIPKSIKLVFWRLSLFYLLSLLVIGLLLPYNDPQLLNTTSVSASPYTIVLLEHFGGAAATIINAIILIAIISAANASMYSASRILWYMGEQQQTFTLFKHATRNGVPLPAVLATALIAALLLWSSQLGAGKFFTIIVQMSSLCGFIAWFGIALSHFEFRRRILAKIGGESILLYKAKFYPAAQLFSMLAIIIIIVAQYLSISPFNYLELLITYSSLIVFLVIYFAHKIYYHHHAIMT